MIHAEPYHWLPSANASIYSHEGSLQGIQLGQAMDPTEARQTLESFLGMFRNLKGNFSGDAWVGDPEAAGLEPDYPIAWMPTPLEAQNFNRAVETLVARAGQITGRERGDFVRAGLVPANADLATGDTLDGLIISTEELLKEWDKSQGKRGFPWAAVLGVVGVATATGAAIYFTKRAPRRRRRRRR